MALDQNGKEFLDHVFTGVDGLLASGASGNKGQVTMTTHSLLLLTTPNTACCDTPNTLAIIC